MKRKATRSIDRAWKARIEEAEYHVDAVKVILAGIEDEPKGKEEIIRTLQYALWVLRENHSNLVDVYKTSK